METYTGEERRVSPCPKVVDAGERVVKLEVLVAMALDNDEKLLKLLESAQAADARTEERLNKMDTERAKVVGGVTVLCAIGSVIIWAIDKLASKVGL